MAHSIITLLTNHIAKQKLIAPGETIIIGLSGGPDSVFLLYFLHQLRSAYNLTLIAAHLNHEWRDTADRDELFCKQLCEALNIPFVAKKMSELCMTRNYDGSKEAYARYARRLFFELCVQQHGASKIALAHHKDDQEETFFIRLFRGASLSGLTGMKEQDGLYIRPLLHITKKDILDYLHHHEIAYRIDETNESSDYLRNRIRNQLIPVCNAIDARFPHTLTRTLRSLQTTEDYLEKHTDEVFTTISQVKDTKIFVDQAALLQLHPALQYRCILKWLCTEKVPFTPSESFFDEIIRFLENKAPSHRLLSSWKLCKDKGQLTLQCVKCD